MTRTLVWRFFAAAMAVMMIMAMGAGVLTPGRAEAVPALPGDEIGVFRPSTSMWFLDHNDNGTWDGPSIDWLQGDFGRSDDIPVVGDWNADNVTEIGVFRPSTRMWYLDYNGDGRWNLAPGDDLVKGDFGLIGDKPVVGDWNNDGRDEIGVFRPSTRMWYLDYNNNGKWDGMILTGGNDIWAGTTDDRIKGDFGLAGDIPVVGDWNNNGTDEIGVFRPSTRMWYLDYNNTGKWDGPSTDRVKGDFGLAGDKPVVGDWNNDGTDEIGVFRPSTRMWYLDYNNNGKWNGTIDDRVKGDFGFSTDIPVVGKWYSSTPLPANPTAPNLGEAGRMVILASQTVTTTGTTAISNGDMVIMDQARSYFLTGGFTPIGPAGDFTQLTGGTSFASDDANPAPFPYPLKTATPTIGDPWATTLAMVDQVRTDSNAAYVFLAAQTIPAPAACPTELGGKTLYRGIYVCATPVQIEQGDLTLDAQGDSASVWIFQLGNLFTTGAPNGNIILAHGAQAKNVYFQVAGEGINGTVIGSGTHFYGNVLSAMQINVADGAHITGRLFSKTAQVTLIANTVTKGP